MIPTPKKIQSAAHNRTTYAVGLLQAKAYRVLKQETNKVLKPFNVSSIEWALLGMLFEMGGVRPMDAALQLGVEAPFITEMVGRLIKQDLVAQKRNTKDSRKKTISLTRKGRVFVRTTEVKVRAQMRHLVSGVSPADLTSYFLVLSAITENAIEK